MTDYDNTNRGSIWKNDKKDTEKHPDFTGTLNVNGVEFWVSAWKRKADASEKTPALNFSVKPKEDRGNQSPREGAGNQNFSSQGSSGGKFNDFDDDIPF